MTTSTTTLTFKLKDKEFKVDCTTTETIKELKEKLRTAAEVKEPIEAIRIIVGGTFLKNESTVGDYNLEAGRPYNFFVTPSKEISSPKNVNSATNSPVNSNINSTTNSNSYNSMNMNNDMMSNMNNMFGGGNLDLSKMQPGSMTPEQMQASMKILADNPEMLEFALNQLCEQLPPDQRESSKAIYRQYFETAKKMGPPPTMGNFQNPYMANQFNPMGSPYGGQNQFTGYQQQQYQQQNISISDEEYLKIYKAQLESLKEMGFKSEELNLIALKKVHGNIDQAIELLVSWRGDN